MAQLKDIRDNILRNIGLCIKNNCGANEEEITARVLQPFAVADMAFGLLQEVCEPAVGKYAVQHEQRLLYCRAKRIYSKKIFKGLLYKNLTEDEVMLFNDFMDKVNDAVQHDMQILHYQLQDHMMCVEQHDRETICKVLASEVLSLLAHDSLQIDLKVNIRELSIISKLTHRISCSMLSKTGIKEIHFTDKMFEKTLTALFGKITRVTTEGI